MVCQIEAANPVLSNFELPRKARFFPLGFPLEIETNSSAVLDAAARSWDKFSPEFSGTAVRLSIGVAPAAGENFPGPPIYRARENLLSIVSDPANFVVCDFDRSFGYGWVTEEAVADSEFFRYYFLEAAALSLVEQAHGAPVHGALVELEGRGVLLCGDTCAGKSTLAFACAREGWTFISDNGTLLVRERGGRFGVGNPHSLRFREDAPRLFPELASRMAGVRANGKISIEISTDELPGIKTASANNIDHIVFLNRKQASRAVLKSHRLDDSRWFEDVSTLGTRAVLKAQAETYKNLLRCPTWELTYEDLASAVSRLKALVREGF